MEQQQDVSAGVILSVNVSDRKGQKKHAVGEVVLKEDFGIENDAHAGMEIRQVSLLAQESIDRIRALGLEVGPGDFAENLTTKGLVLHTLPLGTRLLVGDHVLLELTQIGKTCHDRCAIFKAVGDCVMPREGVFVRVLSGGTVKEGDDIRVVGS
ncbi:MAG TPA: MOSC domain-containing protein [Deltaproteobacteria bacterium]|jgi:MOSC domain-containing protein YiiM|nr:MOSC domain-containing protein [Deltaproteobacteria bacterium]HOI05570.1 MOSC domain-containing protein [Deltaproteobacteria bacterium]